MPEEILPPGPQTEGFLTVDPRDGFGVRNFHIQVGKFAILSDVIVYGDEETDSVEVMTVAKRVSEAQVHTRSLYNVNGVRNFPTYSTFVVQGELAMSPLSGITGSHTCSPQIHSASLNSCSPSWSLSIRLGILPGKLSISVGLHLALFNSD